MPAAAPWPSRPVHLVVPFAPGGGTDIIARTLGQKLSETFGQQFVVDNRAGGGGTIGAEMVAKAAPDGYTMCMVSASYGANAALFKIPYDPANGIAPISLLAVGPLIVVAGPSLKAGNLKELIALAHAQPNALNFGSTGVGSLAHLMGALLNQMTGIQTVHVPYKGAGPALIDMLAGNLHFGYYTAVAVQPYVKSNRLRALAVTTAKRVDAFPGVPTVGEMVPGYVAEHWYGMWGTRGTPPDVIARVNQALGRFLQLPEVSQRIVDDGFVPAHSTPEEYRQRIASDVARWKDVVRRADIKVDVNG
jgi:tripartite-type tricarboxylate transporter receptor subunit TctC